MSVFAAPGAYDRAITVFSPDGRLFQVEYALETVNRGATILGVACSEGIVLGAEERQESALQDERFVWKLFEIDQHLGAAVVGLGSDARILIDQARVYAQSNRLMYDEAIDVEVVAKSRRHQTALHSTCRSSTFRCLHNIRRNRQNGQQTVRN